MKSNRIIWTALAAALVSAPAYAQVEVRVSGASALQFTLEKTIANQVCTAPGTIYNNGTFGNTYVCPSAFGTATIRKRDSGGSGTGTVNLNTAGSSLAFVDETSASCALSGAVGGSTVGGVAGWTRFTGCGNKDYTVMYGMSDVEPALFGNLGAVNNVVGSPILAQVFGIPVSDKLYRKLQAIQGLSDVNATTFDPANAPSISAAQYAALASGAYVDWTQVDENITEIAAGSGTAVKFCRRVPTSGTQTTFNAILLNNPCGVGNGSALVPGDNNSDDNIANDGNVTNNHGPANGVYTIVMNSGSGDVDNCLTAADNQNEMAIGLLGTERLPEGADKWHYVKLDGVYPSVANARTGQYKLVAEASFNRNPAITYSASQEAIAQILVTGMGDPATILADNLLGVAAIPDNGFDPTDPSTGSVVLKGSRGGNTCRPFQLLY